LVGDDDGLGAISGADFGQDAFGVGLCGGFRDDEEAGDLLVGIALGDEPEYL
jgi:hypothetical protein